MSIKLSFQFVLLLTSVWLALATTALANEGVGIGADAAVSVDADVVMCTADAYQCPDGSWVGRTGPRCEFVCNGEVVDEDRGSSEGNSGASVGVDGNISVEPDGGIGDGATPLVPGFVVVAELGNRNVAEADVDTDGHLRGIAMARSSGASEFEVAVRSEEVRAWSDETKQEVREHLQVIADKLDNASDIGLYLAITAIDNGGVAKIEASSDEGVTLWQPAKVKLFGFIPLTVNAKTRVEADGEVATTTYGNWLVDALSTKVDTNVGAEVAANVAANIAWE